MQKVWLDITRWAGLLPEEFLNATWVTIPSFLCARLWSSGCFSSRWFLYKAHEESLSTFTATWAIGNFFFFFFLQVALFFPPKSPMGRAQLCASQDSSMAFWLCCLIWAKLVKGKSHSKTSCSLLHVECISCLFFFYARHKNCSLGSASWYWMLHNHQSLSSQ